MILCDEAHEREHVLRLASRRPTEHEHFSGGRLRETDCELQKRRLACPVRAHKRRHGPGGDCERAVAKRPLGAVSLPERLCHNGWLAAHAALSVKLSRSASS